MSSSQGANNLADYPFDTNSIRDASDWIRYKREARKYTNYKTSSSDNKDTEPVWLKYGNQFRLTYSFGRWKCDTICQGNAFNGPVGEESPP
jgi:hypothetical protein